MLAYSVSREDLALPFQLIEATRLMALPTHGGLESNPKDEVSFSLVFIDLICVRWWMMTHEGIITGGVSQG